MAKALSVATQFTAIDKYSATMNKMSKATTSFNTKAQTQFARTERAGRSLGSTFDGVAGKALALAGGLAIGAERHGTERKGGARQGKERRGSRVVFDTARLFS